MWSREDVFKNVNALTYLELESIRQIRRVKTQRVNTTIVYHQLWWLANSVDWIEKVIECFITLSPYGWATKNKNQHCNNVYETTRFRELHQRYYWCYELLATAFANLMLGMWQEFFFFFSCLKNEKSGLEHLRKTKPKNVQFIFIL